MKKVNGEIEGEVKSFSQYLTYNLLNKQLINFNSKFYILNF